MAEKKKKKDKNIVEALFDMEEILRSKKEKMTSQEVNVLMAWKGQALRAFSIGTLGSSFVTWFATSRVPAIVRLNLTVGLGVGVGLWRFDRSLDSCVDHILSMEGTRMRNELAKIMLTNYHDDPSMMQRVARHFYSEIVYDESTSTKLRWHVRNSLSDYVDSEKISMQHDDTYGDKNYKEDVPVADKTKLQMNQQTTTAVTMTDPLDCLFGLPAAVEKINQSDASIKLSRRHSRSQKRSHRRHGRRHQELYDA